MIWIATIRFKIEDRIEAAVLDDSDCKLHKTSRAKWRAALIIATAWTCQPRRKIVQKLPPQKNAQNALQIEHN